MLLRTCCALLFLASGLLAQAQGPAYYFFRTETPMQSMQLKMIIEAVMSLDPNAGIYHSDDMTIVQIKHNGSFNEQMAREAIASTGVALRAEIPTDAEMGRNTVDPNAPPIYIVTGDEAADQARYQMAVEQWNAAHPQDQLSTIPVHRR